MVSKELHSSISDLYEKTQENTLSKLISGTFLGLIIFLAIFVVTIVTDQVFTSWEWLLLFNRG